MFLNAEYRRSHQPFSEKRLALMILQAHPGIPDAGTQKLGFPE